MAVSGPQEPNRGSELGRPPLPQGVATGISKVSVAASKALEGAVPGLSNNLNDVGIPCSPQETAVDLKGVLSCFSPKSEEVIKWINTANEKQEKADIKRSLPEKQSAYDHVIDGACQDFCRAGHVQITIGNWNPFIRVIASDKKVEEQANLRELNKLVGKRIYSCIEGLFRKFYGEVDIKSSNQATLNTWIAFTFVYQMGTGVIMSLANERQLLSSMFKPTPGHCTSMVIREPTDAQSEIEIEWTQKVTEMEMDGEGVPTIPGQQKTVTAHLKFPQAGEPTLSLTVENQSGWLAQPNSPSVESSSLITRAWKSVFG